MAHDVKLRKVACKGMIDYSKLKWNMFSNKLVEMDNKILRTFNIV